VFLLEYQFKTTGTFKLFEKKTKSDKKIKMCLPGQLETVGRSQEM